MSLRPYGRTKSQGQLRGRFDLGRGVGVPEGELRLEFVLGADDLVFGVFGLEPGPVGRSNPGAAAGVVHFNTDGVVVQSREAFPVAHAAVPGLHIKGGQLDKAPVRAITRCAEAWSRCCTAIRSIAWRFGPQ